MGTARILLADNDRKSLRVWSEILCDAGFDVTEATSVSTTRKALEKGGFDLAVLDLHLERDQDEHDDSGLRLAERFSSSVAIIILTGAANKRALLWAVQADRNGCRFISVVEKSHGPEILLSEICRGIAFRSAIPLSTEE